MIDGLQESPRLLAFREYIAGWEPAPCPDGWKPEPIEWSSRRAAGARAALLARLIETRAGERTHGEHDRIPYLDEVVRPHRWFRH